MFGPGVSSIKSEARAKAQSDGGMKALSWSKCHLCSDCRSRFSSPRSASDRLTVITR